MYFHKMTRIFWTKKVFGVKNKSGESFAGVWSHLRWGSEPQPLVLKLQCQVRSSSARLQAPAPGSKLQRQVPSSSARFEAPAQFQSIILEIQRLRAHKCGVYCRRAIPPYSYIRQLNILLLFLYEWFFIFLLNTIHICCTYISHRI